MTLKPSSTNRLSISRLTSSVVAAICATAIAATLLGIVPSARAQDDNVVMQLAWPAEGETLYAGQTSLLYSVPVNGWVQGNDLDYQGVIVVLEILQGQEVVERISTTPDNDGGFLFLLTVNPDGSDGSFPAEHLTCGDYCHLPGEVDLPGGNLILRITATAPANKWRSTIERNITVDRSVHATVPIEVYLGGDLEQPISEVVVSGSTRLYDWRTRNVRGATNERGMAYLQVEALTQAPTHYIFSASPTIVEGVLYEPIDSAEITIAPGDESTAPVVLNVSAKMGEIQGLLESTSYGLVDDVPIVAIQIPSGVTFRTLTGEDGHFSFEELPINRYRISVDDEFLTKENLRAGIAEVDLFSSVESIADIKAVKLDGSRVDGRIIDDSGAPIPYAWITHEESDLMMAALPPYGQYMLSDLPKEPLTLVARAPGYYSLARRVDPSADRPDANDFILTRQEGTEEFPWGQGGLVVPSDSIIEQDDIALTLRSGWLWGQIDGEPLPIRVAGQEITLQNAAFSLEYLPGKRAWLYVTNGSAEVTPIGSSESTVVHSGNMINLLNDGELAEVPIEQVVIQALNDDPNPPVPIVWEPTLGARIENGLARLSIGAAQVITFVTYFFVLLGVLVIPLSAVFFWWGRRS